MFAGWRLIWDKLTGKREPPAHILLVIVLPGEHDIPIFGLTGVSLRIVDRKMYEKHQGLKYWAASGSKGKERGDMAKKELAGCAYEDIMNLIFQKKPRPFTGIRIDSKGKVTSSAPD